MLFYYNPAKYDLNLLESYVSDLTAIMRLEYNDLIFYHASFSDFLGDKSRSGEHHIDLNAFRAKILPAIWMRASKSPNCR